jgi:hypothetical protein
MNLMATILMAGRMMKTMMRRMMGILGLPYAVVKPLQSPLSGAGGLHALSLLPSYRRVPASGATPLLLLLLP